MGQKAGTKTTKRKVSFETAIAIANILLTIITGIVITIYLQNKSLLFQEQLQVRDQEFQRQLLELQKAEEQKSSMAYIQVSSLCLWGQQCSGAGGIQVTNSGAAPAENLRIAIYIDRVNSHWEEQITSIDKFDFTTTNASLPYTTEITNTAYRPTLSYPKQLKGNNTLIINIEKLPPDESIGFIFSPGSKLTMEQKTVTTRATITAPGNIASAWDRFLFSHMEEYMSKYESISLLLYEMTCNNCEYSRKFDTFLIPSLIRLEGVEFLNEIELNALNQEVAQVEIKSSYWVTKTSTENLPPDYLNLLLEANDNGDYSITQSNP